MLELVANAAASLFEGRHEPKSRQSTAQKISDWLGVERPKLCDDPAFIAMVCLALSPVSAIRYRATDPTPRWKYVKEYIDAAAGLESERAERLARIVAGTLDALARPRSPATSHHEEILRLQRYRCACCRAPFRETARSVLTQDRLRPVWLAPEELCRPEVDHISPIRWSGDNSFKNLQVLCRACNAAKSDGLRIPINSEALYAQVPLEDVPRIHFFRLLVWLVRDCGGFCSICGRAQSELTMRLIRSNAPLLRCNLRLACYDCAPSSA